MADGQDLTEQMMEAELGLEIFEATRDAVICYDSAGRVTALNGAAQHLLGLPADKGLGVQLVDVFAPKHLETGRPIAWCPQRSLEENLGLEFDEPVSVQAADGVERFVSLRLVPCKGGSYGVLLFSDDTDRVRLERQIVKSQRHASLSLMAGGVAHDFNNILTGVLGNLSLVSAMESDPKISQTVASAEKAAERARALANQFLSLCRRERSACRRKVFNVRELLEEACSLITCGTQCQYEISIVDHAEEMHADEDQMSQVFNNLIINAVQAMDGAGLIHVRVSTIELSDREADDLLVDSGEHFRIDFEDSGPGITAENIAKIFDPYYTTKSEGSGLGLASCRTIIRRHGGALTVASEPGRGSCFSCVIPRSSHAPDDVAQTTDTPTDLHSGKGRILVMDDEEMILQIARDMLELLGYEAGVCKDGEAMLKEYQQALDAKEPYDAVVLDLTIPGKMGGREAMTKLLEIDPEAVGVVSSGYSNDPVMERPTEFGFTVAMQKPYTVQEFSALLSSLKV